MYHYMQSAEETSKEISKVYHKASLVLSNEMDKIFERFVTKHKLSEDDARKLLTSIKDKTSLEEIKAELRKGATGSDKRELLAELESPAYAYRLNRLEDKQQQIDNLMNTVYNQEKALSTDHYKELMGESYNRSMYEIQRQAGIGYSFDKLDSKTIDNMLKSKWSGANYSSRIWNNTQKLADSLKTELIIGLLTGEREADISKNLMFQFASGANNARRLVRTESCHIANEMDMKAYKESGIDTYVFVATLDLRTSAICASLDGKRFKVKDQQPGVNAPPMHPWCRSTTICDISDEELSQMKRRSKNPVTGKSELVPANMTYEEWHKKYAADDKSVKKKEDIKIKNEIILQAGTNLRFEGATVNDGNIKMKMRVVKPDTDIKDKSGLRIIKANELKTIDSQERKFIKVNKQQDYKPVYVNQNINIQKNRNNVMIEAYKSINSKNDVYISNKVSLKPKELHTIDKGITDTYKLLGNIDKYRKPKIVIIGEEEFASSALASYNAKDNVLYINKLMGNKLKIKELQKGYAASNNPLSTYYHEILHWSDAQKYVEKYGKIDHQSEYVKWIINKSKKDVEKLIKSNYNIYDISDYAKDSLNRFRYDEVFTEYRVKERLGD